LGTHGKSGTVEPGLAWLSPGSPEPSALLVLVLVFHTHGTTNNLGSDIISLLFFLLPIVRDGARFKYKLMGVMVYF
jgi:hypothetical protein